MTSLTFTLDPDAMVRMHDAFVCLAKFSDTVALEAEQGLLRMSALNSTKTAFASFVLDKEEFFQEYDFSVSKTSGFSFHSEDGDRFYCQIMIKVFLIFGIACLFANLEIQALLSVFHGRVDKGKETAIEVCYAELHEDPDETECRLNFRMICDMGVIKSYRLTYEPASIQHAMFDHTNATNTWSASPLHLKQILEHFTASAEQLDLCGDMDQANFTSITKRITISEGEELLKTPVNTIVAATKIDFEEWSVEDNMHVAINLKDFKALVAHAETGMATVKAQYTRPCKPMQLSYEIPGIKAKFTLMTRGEADDDTPESQKAPRPHVVNRAPRGHVPTNARDSMAPFIPYRPSVHDRPEYIAKMAAWNAAQNATQNTAQNAAQNTTQNTPMPPPSARNRPLRPLQGSSTQDHLSRNSTWEKPSASASEPEFDSLFVTQDDNQWDDITPKEEPQDILGWDATGQVPIQGILRDAEPDFPMPVRRKRAAQDDMGIPPTQRMSQVRRMGLFE
ncbi:hypothetical protein N7520_000083 [Penicillium odoratum]|uniref:uncharacterized protein n=1 Tax=Penicillium odoratum TaxID=1167516 RepID=UPI0025466451|nr:uncharacterized protein N7520_000083 [Penicillium odoratum]KAJ5776837.1 hypothetical protein N7520_000083 [Penicillium odoratum]